MDKKGFLCALGNFVLGGMLTLYWGLMSHFDSIFIALNRMFWSAIAMIVTILITRRMPVLKAMLKNRRAMLLSIVSSITIAINWSLIIWAVNSGFVLESSLGNFMVPIFMAVASAVVFKEKFTALDIAAVGVAVVGVVWSTIQYGKFPWVAIIIALTSCIYGAVKKVIGADPIVGVAVETGYLIPFVLIGMFVFFPGEGGFASITGVGDVLLLIGAGVFIAIMLGLYGVGLKRISFLIISFMQYIPPTLMFILGIAFLNAELTPDKIINFSCVIVAVVLFCISCVRKHRRSLKEAEQQAVQEATATTESV